MIDFDKELKTVFETLYNNGYECYLVGGCVRDAVMGIAPHDFDITTNALPEKTAECFACYKVVKTGIKHGTVTVIVNQKPFEITTYRIDGDYADSRHPDSVTFSPNLKDDLSRRDFTVNAMAYNKTVGIVDPFGGIGHVKNKIIQTVGNPDLRFNEDALRIMRGIRFASVLDFEIEEDTHKSILKNAGLLKNISVERIYIEFCKAICGKGVDRLLTFFDVFSVIIPEMSKSDFERSVNRLKNCRNKDLILCLSTFFSFTHFDGAKGILKGLKADNATVNSVCELLSAYETEYYPDKYFLKHLISKYDYTTVEKLLLLKQNTGDFSDREYTENQKLLDKIKSENPCLTLFDLNVNGKDLMSAGIKANSNLKIILNNLLNDVIDDKIANEKNILIAKALEFNNKLIEKRR